jgi:hypothetical protein
MKDEELKESKLLLEVEIKNLQKFVDPAKKIVEELELKEELSEEEKKKLEDSKSEVLLLEKEIKEREDKIKEMDEEVKHREEVRLQIDNALKDLNFEEEEVRKRWNRELDKEEEFKVRLIDDFLHEFEFCDHIEIKEELVVDDEVQLDEEGKPIEVVKEVKHIPWDKESVLKDLKLKLDLDKANDLVRRVKAYKHNKKKGELENRLKPLVEDNHYFDEAFGKVFKEIKVDGKLEVHEVHRKYSIEEWDKDDLIDFEEKVVKLEEAKVKIDEKIKKEKPIKDRELEYKRIDGLLLEALVEKLEEDRPEKMVEYLKLRKEIKDKHPLED